MRCKFTQLFSHFLLAMGTLFLLVACTQKRPEKFAQGMGENNLRKVQTYDGETFALCTGDSLGGSSISTAREFVVGEDMKEMNVLPLVSYSSPKADLLPDSLAFYGHPNDCESYRITYKVDDHFLRVFKVAAWKDIPYQERTYAEAIDGQNLFAVPLVGYPVEHVRVEKRLNPDYEETNEFIEVRVQRKEDATDFRFQKSQFLEFAAQAKVNLFPTAYFGFDDPNQEWYYANGVVEAEAAHEDFESLFVPVDGNFDLATQVRFCRLGEHAIGVVNATLDPKRKSLNAQETKMGKGDNLPSCISNRTILSFTAESLDFEVAQAGPQKGMLEKASSRKPWQSKPWVRLDLGNIDGMFGPGEVERVEVQPDSLVLTTTYHHNDLRARIRHTFIRKKNPDQLVGAYHYQQDRKQFYAISYDIPHEAGRLDRSPRAQDRLKMIPRFNPQKHGGVIKYRLVEPSLTRFNSHAEKAFAAVNWALRQAHVGFRVELEKDQQGHYLTTAVGDGRHNFVYYAKSLKGAGTLGTAQVVPDGVTGEVLYGGYRIDVTGIENEVQRDVVNYALSELGIIPSQLIRDRLAIETAPRTYSAYAPTENLKKVGRDLWQNMKSLAPEMLNMPFFYGSLGAPNTPVQFKPGETRDQKNWMAQLISEETQHDSHKQKHLNPLSFACEHLNQNFSGRVFDNLVSPTQLGCRALKEHIASLKGKSRKFITQELDLEIADPCVRELTDDFVVSVSIHELLHTLSLDHNFKGSFDRPNYYKAKHVRPLLGDSRLGPFVSRVEHMADEDEYADSASIMDYQTISDRMLNLPGFSDIQMLRYIYGSHVLAADNSLVQKPVDRELGKSSVSVTEALAARGKNLYPWKTCEDKREPAFDPFCRPFDRGGSPQEVAANYINNFRISLAKGGFQYVNGNQEPAEIIPLRRMFGTLFPLRQIYDHWRLELRRLTGESNRYLAEFHHSTQYHQFLREKGLDPQAYQAHLKQTKSAQSAEPISEMQQWLDAAQTIKDFFLDDVVFMHNRYCTVRPEGSTGLEKVVLLELDRLRTELSGQRTLAIATCQDPALKQWFASRKLVLVEDHSELPAEFGSELLTGMHSTQPKDFIYDSYDYIGTLMDRLNGMMLAALPRPTGPQFYQLGFAPTMMNEPDFTERLTKAFFERVRFGVKVPTSDPARPVFSANFDAERFLLAQYSFLLVMGYGIPDRPMESMQRAVMFQVIPMPSIANSGGDSPAKVNFGGLSLSIPTLQSSLALPLVEDIARLQMTEQAVKMTSQNPFFPPLSELSLNEKELGLLRQNLMDSMPTLPFQPFPPMVMGTPGATAPMSAVLNPAMMSPLTYKQYLPWLRSFKKLMEDPTLTPGLRIALSSLFTTDVQLLSSSTRGPGVALAKIMKTLREAIPQSSSGNGVTTQIGEPGDEASAEPGTGDNELEKLMGEIEQHDSLDRPLEPPLVMRFDRNQLEYRLTEYRIQQDLLTRQLTAFGATQSGLKELAAQRELLFNVLTAFAQGSMGGMTLMMMPAGGAQ